MRYETKEREGIRMEWKAAALTTLIFIISCGTTLLTLGAFVWLGIQAKMIAVFLVAGAILVLLWVALYSIIKEVL